MSMTLFEAIRGRRSIRKFKPGVKISKEHVTVMLEAAMMAPSAGNTRPWEFLVVENSELKKRIVRASPSAKCIEGAALAIIVCGLPDIQRGVMEGFWPQDCAAAIENLMLQAYALGYGTCWCAFYPRMERVSTIQKLFDLSSIPLAVIAIGESDEAPEARGFYDVNKIKYYE